MFTDIYPYRVVDGGVFYEVDGKVRHSCVGVLSGAWVRAVNVRTLCVYISIVVLIITVNWPHGHPIIMSCLNYPAHVQQV